MRFGLIHRLMTDTLATLGLLALVSSGELNPWIAYALLVCLAAALALPQRWQDRSLLRRLALVLPLALLIVQLARWLLGGTLLQTAVEFAAGLQVIRLATRRGATHDQQVVVMALLHLIAGTVLGGGLAYGLCFVGFLVVTPAALVLSHLRREVEGNYRQGARDRTGLPVDVPRILRSRRVIGRRFLLLTCLLSVPIFLFTATLFVMFPRVGLSLLLLGHARPERMIGFSDRVDLGGVGKLRSDPTIAMRVEYPALYPHPPRRLALYLRGTAFDHYDGRTWSRTLTRHVPLRLHGPLLPLRRYPHPDQDRKLTIELEPIDPPVLFFPADTLALKLEPRSPPLFGRLPTIFAGPEGQLRYASTDDRRLRYQVFFPPSDRPPAEARPLTAPERARHLALPPALPQRIADLARAWTAGIQDPTAQAQAIETRLRAEYAYDLESPSGAAPNPLDHFLFESRRGHCEFYSTAMAIMLRTLGIPARNVTGFIGGSYNRFGDYYAVRQGDAHSWVEVYLDGRGWTRFDPTPPADAAPQSEVTGLLAFVRDVFEAATQRWNRHVIGYDLPQQLELLRSAHRTYSGWRGSSPLLRTALGSPRRAILILVGLLLLALGLRRLWRTRRTAKRVAPEPTPQQAHALQIVSLYKSLEAAMAARGVPRQPGTPPLAHAQALSALRHPIANEVLDLTHVYQEARFGGRPLDNVQRTDYARRVRALRQQGDHSPKQAA
jgi:transglutaminase-like putative cysteine protease